MRASLPARLTGGRGRRGLLKSFRQLFDDDAEQSYERKLEQLREEGRKEGKKRARL